MAHHTLPGRLLQADRAHSSITIAYNTSRLIAAEAHGHVLTIVDLVGNFSPPMWITFTPAGVLNLESLYDAVKLAPGCSRLSKSYPQSGG